MSYVYLEFCTRDPVDPDGDGEKEVHYDFTRKLPYPRDWDEREGQGRMRQWPRRESIEGLVRKAIIDFDWDEEIGGPMPAEFGDAELNIAGDIVDAPGSPYMDDDGSVHYEILTESWMIHVEVT
jgi:hypothetical protein